MDDRPAIELRSCSFGYAKRLVVNEVSFAIPRGQVVAMAGPNGAGKTTLLRLITGRLRPGSGRVAVNGLDPAGTPARVLARRLAVVPQDAEFQFPYTVGEVVRMGRTPYLGFWGFESGDDVAAADRALAFCDLKELAGRFITQISGGERQRAIIARALAQAPEILILDEPTRSLDPRHSQDILGIVQRIRRETRLTVVMVTHDLNTVAGFADRLLLIHGGRVVRDGAPGDVLSPDCLRETFGVETEILRSSDGRPVVVPVGERRSDE